MRTLSYFLILLTGILLTGCSGNGTEEQAAAGEYYTCPMHPNVRSDKPGACPVCNMTLIKVSDATGKNETGLKLTDQQRKLANIRTYEVASGKLGALARLTGKVVLDQNAAEVITAQVAGRIDKLMVRSAGEKVQKGQALYEIYSEQLLAAQQEYLLARQQEGVSAGDLYQQLGDASRQKLKLWGMSESQINRLAGTGKSSPRITYFSPVAGTVMEVLAQEGSYVAEGTPVLRLAELASVWVQAQLYPAETGLEFQKDHVKIVAEAFPKDTLTGQLVLNNPVLEQGRQINLATFKVHNQEGKLKPGMPAYVLVKQPGGSGILVPKAAVVPGEMPMVWIENKDGSFEPRMVKTGAGNKDWVEIRSGLKGREKVVVQGVYLLNSEYILKKEADPMARHKH